MIVEQYLSITAMNALINYNYFLFLHQAKITLLIY